jgi:hypothetical protein
MKQTFFAITLVLILLFAHAATPQGHFKDVMIPNSPVSDTVRPALFAKLNTLPPGIAKQIRDAQNYNPGVSTPTSLKRDIQYQETERQLKINSLFNYWSDSDSTQRIIDVLETETSKEAKQTLVATYMLVENYTMALDRLNTLPLNTTEDMAFYDVHKEQIDLYASGKTLWDLDSTGIARIREIAGMCPASIATGELQLVIPTINWPAGNYYYYLYTNNSCLGMGNICVIH